MDFALPGTCQHLDCYCTGRLHHPLHSTSRAWLHCGLTTRLAARTTSGVAEGMPGHTNGSDQGCPQRMIHALGTNPDSKKLCCHMRVGIVCCWNRAVGRDLGADVALSARASCDADVCLPTCPLQGFQCHQHIQPVCDASESWLCVEL